MRSTSVMELREDVLGTRPSDESAGPRSLPGLLICPRRLGALRTTEAAPFFRKHRESGDVDRARRRREMKSGLTPAASGTEIDNLPTPEVRRVQQSLPLTKGKGACDDHPEWC